VHPGLIDLDTSDEYQWVGDGYAHEGDHDFRWSRDELTADGNRLAEIDSLNAVQLTELRAKSAAGD
jgi:hypothetical protein